MVLVRFKNKEEHMDLMKKVKKMKSFIEDIEDLFEECYEDGADYRDEYDEDMMRERDYHMNGRYGYRRGGGSRGSRM